MTSATPRIRVAVVFGGVSSEHDVSCLTAGGVSRALDRERFEVVGIGITPTGRWVQVPEAELVALEVVDHQLPRLDEARPSAAVTGTATGAQVATMVEGRLTDVREFEVAFSLLHGPFGEDGTIQGMFEMLGVRYVGSGVAASAIGMDKDLMKRALSAAGLPGCRFVAFTPRQLATDLDGCIEAVNALTFPVYVKPARGGSSMGISRVTDPSGLVAALAEAERFDPKVIVEEGFVGAREIELAVLGGRDGGPPRVSLPGEIRMHTDDAFYDFEAKYLPEQQVSLDVPADVDAHLVPVLQDTAIRAFEALGAEGLSRVDLFLTADGEVFVNEINTMPGFTRTSMFPSMWAASGLPYTDLIADLITQALQRRVGLR
ncbi:MAG: D-alanine--D-alanine ligase family protein [Micropruina sp.]